jgi:hypothetical protein
MHDSYNHQSLAIFRSVAEHGDLDAAMISAARRCGISPSRVRGEVCLIASRFYQAGLLQPARDGGTWERS